MGGGGGGGGRVQHELGSEFDAFGAELVLDELMGGALLDNQEQVG